MATSNSFSDSSTQGREYATLLSLTLDEVLGNGSVEDNVYNNDPTLQEFHSGGRVKVIQGGERIRIPVMTGEGGTFKWYSGLEPLTITPQEGVTTAWFTWKQASVSVSISGLEKRQNMGQAQIADIVRTKFTQAEADMAKGLATGLFSDGTGSGGKQMSGFDAAMPADPTTGTYGNIDSSQNAAWRSKINNSVGSAAANLVTALRTQYNSCSIGRSATSAPDLIVTDQTTHEALEALIAPRVRYTAGGEAELNTNKVKFNNAEVIWDPFCPAGTMYVLNTAHIMMFVHSNANLVQSEEGFQKPIDQDGLVSQIFFMGNVAVNNRRKIGSLRNIT